MTFWACKCYTTTSRKQKTKNTDLFLASLLLQMVYLYLQGRQTLKL